MAKERNVLDRLVLAQIGAVATLNEKLKDSVDEYVDKGESTLDRAKEVNAELKRRFDDVVDTADKNLEASKKEE